jgi:predicted GNAT family acetyltransferase
MSTHTDSVPANDGAVSVRHEPERNRYVLSVEGRSVSVADYVDRGDVLVMNHTETAPAHGGKGYAKRLVTHALDDVRRRGLKVVPSCWYVAQVIDEEPQYADLVAA